MSSQRNRSCLKQQLRFDELVNRPFRSFARFGYTGAVCENAQEYNPHNRKGNGAHFEETCALRKYASLYKLNVLFGGLRN